MDRAVSLVSRVAAVREALVEQQRRIAGDGGIVVVGRDIGTVVLPDADLKVYLVASVAERARRRYVEIKQMGGEVPYQQVLKDMEARDDLDTGRSHSPLRPADDAVQLVTDGVPLGDVMEMVLALAGEE